MEQKINIAELLKDAPRGIKLYSPLCGECELTFKSESCISVKVKGMIGSIDFNIDGTLMAIYKSECLLFPSKDCRTWENFKAPWKHKHFEAGEKVLVKTDFFDVCKVEVWCLDLYSHYDERHDTHCLIGGSWCSDDRILPYKGNESLLGKEVNNG